MLRLWYFVLKLGVCLKHSAVFWLIGGMPKSLCNHELSVVIFIVVIVIVIIICDQFSFTHTKSKNVPSLHVVSLSYNFTSTKVHFCMY